MKTAEQYIKDKFNIEMPKDKINGQWFADNGLPMVVECCCCGTTMALPSAMIDEKGNIFCSQCAED